MKVFGNGFLDISGHNAPGVATGSIQGNGLVFLGALNLTVGRNNLDTIFSGSIQDGGRFGGSGGSLTKVGTGTIVLRNSNTFTGGTTIKQRGKLLVNNTSGSGTGTGAVQVNAGTLGGKGTIAGDVTVGDGSGRGAVLSPGETAVRRGTLTIQSTLTFNSDASYDFGLNSSNATADEVAQARLVAVDRFRDPLVLLCHRPLFSQRLSHLQVKTPERGKYCSHARIVCQITDSRA